MRTVDLVIKSGKVVTPTGIMSTGIAVDEGKIVAISRESFLPEAKKAIDAKGKYILPGVVDPHVHLGGMEAHPLMSPFDEQSESETKGAAVGGVTTVGIFFFEPKEGNLKAFDRAKAIWESKSVIDGFFHSGVCSTATFAELERCPDFGIISFKFPIGYKGPHAELIGADLTDDGAVFDAFTKIPRLGSKCVAIIHAENIDIGLKLGEILRNEGRKDFRVWHDSRPNFVEAECMNRTICLAHVAKCPLYFVHVTIAEGVDIMAKAKAEGINVVAETCPQYLTHNNEEGEEYFGKNPTLACVNPPIRSKRDNELLWKGIQQGVIECMGSDLASYTLKQKGDNIWKAPMGLGCTSGMMLPVMLSEGVNKGRISLEKVVEICCYNPARVFGVYPQKGNMALGADADLAIVDLDKEMRVTSKTIPSLSDWNIWEGRKIKGWPVMTILRGEIIMEDGQVTGKPGTGKYIHRKPS